MTSTAGSPPSPPAGEPQGGKTGEDGRIRSFDERFGKIEAEQGRQGGILERIEQVLQGHPKAGAPATGAGSTGGQSGPAPGDGSGLSVAEQVRRGVQEIEDKRKADADAQAARDADATWRSSIEQQLAERRPAEPGAGRRSKLQRFLFGKPDPR